MFKQKAENRIGLYREVRADYADAADFLRVACVVLIAWFHIWQQSWLSPNHAILGVTLNLYPLVTCGYIFVDLMLMLSGFLLMLGLKNGRVTRVGDFYRARAARILPSYLFCLAVMLFVFALPEKLYAKPADMWADLLPHLGFIHNYFYASYIGTHLNGVMWTLAVEVQFYLLFPLLGRAFLKKPAVCYCLMVLASTAAKVYVLSIPDNSLYFNRLLPMLDVYANGMAAACVYVYLAKRLRPGAVEAVIHTLLTAAALVVIYRLSRIERSFSAPADIRMGQLMLRYPLSLAGAVFVVAGSRSLACVRSLFSNRLIRFLSGLSFNFYIWHQFLAVKLKLWRIPYYEGVDPNRGGLQPWQNQYTLCCFLVALLAAALTTYLIEKPCARLIRRHLKGTPHCAKMVKE